MIRHSKNYQIINLTNAEKELFINAGYAPLPTVLAYNSSILFKTKQILCAALSSRSKKCDNSCLLVTSGFDILQKIVLFDQENPNQCFLIITKLQSASFELCKDDVTDSQFN